MSFNFPSSPTEGAVYTTPIGKQYVFKSGMWTQVYTAQAALTAQTRNRIVNGAMQIAQEVAHGTASGVTNTYIADQWVAYFVTAGIPSFAVNSTYRPDDPDSEWWLRLNNSSPDTSIAAGDYYTVRQAIEGIRIADFKWGTANAKPAVLRFKAYSGIAGTFCVSLRNSAGTKTFVKNCVIAANVGTTFVIPIPPVTTGVWLTDNSKALDLNFTVMAGTTYNTGVDNQWSDSGAIATPAIGNWMSAASQPLDISAVGLYLDPDATGVAPKWEMPDEAEELAACQRYYIKTGQLLWWGYNGAGAMCYNNWFYPVIMRAAPTFVYGTVGYANASGLGTNSNTPEHLRVQFSITVAGSGYAYAIMQASARM